MKGIVMDKLQMIKLVASSIVGVGSSKIAYSIIRNNTDPETVVDHVTIAAGSFVIGGMVTEATKDYTNRMIDEVVDAFKTLRQDTKNEN